MENQPSQNPYQTPPSPNPAQVPNQTAPMASQEPFGAEPPKKSGMLKWIILGIVIIGGGVAYFLLFPKASAEDIANEITISISEPRSSYAAGQTLSILSSASYAGGSAGKGIAVFEVSHAESGKSCDSSSTLLFTKDSTASWTIRPFHMDANSVSCNKESFNTPGEYTFTVSVFSCDEVKRVLNSDSCSLGREDDLLESGIPLKTLSRTTTVTQ